MIFRYKTPCCTFILEQIPSGEWGIFINGDMCYSACETIEDAIDDICCGATGFLPWDTDAYLNQDVPDDIQEWECIG